MKNSRDSHIVVSKQFDLLENARIDFCIEEHFNLISKFRHNHQIHRFDLINSSD